MKVVRHEPALQAASLCLISARNLGDAVIHARFLRGLVDQGTARTYLVWTFPAARFLFEGIPGCAIVISDFPMGATIRSFLGGGYRGFLRALASAFRYRPELVLELVSDYRERFVAALLMPRRRLHMYWPDSHPFRRHSRIPSWRGRPFVDVPFETANIYEAYNLAFAALTGSEQPLFDASHKPVHEGRPTVALHPLASQAFKLWPAERWRELMRALSQRGCSLVLLGAPSDRPQLDELAADQPFPVEVFTRPLPELIARLRDVDVLVGLDSFSVHLASDVGIATVLLNGANDPRVFTPIGSEVANRPGVCPFQPCYGKPACIGKSYQYACMNSITTTEVLSLVEASLRGSAGVR